MIVSGYSHPFPVRRPLSDKAPGPEDQRCAQRPQEFQCRLPTWTFSILFPRLVHVPQNVARLLSALSLDPNTLKLAPSRDHVWIVAIHEPETLRDAAKAFLESPITMALLSPDPNGPASLSQAPQVALLRAGSFRIVLLRKLFPAKMSESPLSQKAGTPWIRPSLIPGARWKASGISSDEDAPPLSVPGPFLFDLVLGNLSVEEFDALMDKASPWKWKDVETLAKKSGLTAREVAEMIRKRNTRPDYPSI